MVRIKLLRGDTLEEVTTAGANNAYFVRAANQAAGTIKVFVHTTGAANPALDAIIPATGDVNAPLVLVLEDFATNPAGYGDSDVAKAVYTQATKECEGIFGNLANPTHFTVSRAGAVTGAPLRAKLFRSVPSQTKAGALTRAELTLPMMQGAMDAVILESGSAVDCIYMNPLQRQMYVLKLQGTVNATNLQVDTTKAAHGDGGFLGLSYSGVPIKTSRHISNGMLVFLHTKVWKITSLQDGEFADLDGAVLSRVTNQDSYEGYYRWYWNIVCTNPNKNTILSGVKLSAT